MSKMRAVSLIAVITLQIATLAYLVADKENILRDGDTVYLRALPLDPREPMRGDYLRLAYTLNQISQRLYKGPKEFSHLARGDRVYAVLRRVGNGVYELESALSERPSGGVFLRGRVQSGVQAGDLLRVNYGIEQLFVEQGQDHVIEERQNSTAGEFRQVMEVALAVDRQGRSIVTGFRWAPLALSVQPVAAGGGAGTQLHIQLKNFGDYPLSIVDNAEHCAFVLTVENRAESSAPVPCNRYVLSEDDIVELAPGEIYGFTIDLAHRRWFVEREGGASDARDIAKVSQLRLVYRMPTAPLVGFDSKLWQGEIASAAFSWRGWE